VLFSKPCKYAIRGLSEMARTPPGTVHTVAQLAARLSIPQASLAKVFQRLAKGGVLAASTGRSGGYFLIKNPAPARRLCGVTGVPLTQFGISDKRDVKTFSVGGLTNR